MIFFDEPDYLMAIKTPNEKQKPNALFFFTEISKTMAKCNIRDGHGEGAGPNLNRKRKTFERASYKFVNALKRVID